jgi:hypothetical protein
MAGYRLQTRLPLDEAKPLVSDILEQFNYTAGRLRYSVGAICD